MTDVRPIHIDRHVALGALAAQQAAAAQQGRRMGKFVEATTLAAALLGVPNLRHFEVDILNHLIDAIKSRREEFIEHDREELSSSVLLRFLDEGRTDLVEAVYGFENIQNVESVWLFHGVTSITNKQLSTKDQSSALRILNGLYNSEDQKGAQADAIEFIAQHQDYLLNTRKWQEQGNTVFQMYMDKGNLPAREMLEKYRPMLDAGGARQVIPRMKAWDSRLRLLPIGSETPVKRRPAGM